MEVLNKIQLIEKIVQSNSFGYEVHKVNCDGSYASDNLPGVVAKNFNFDYFDELDAQPSLESLRRDIDDNATGLFYTLNKNEYNAVFGDFLWDAMMLEDDCMYDVVIIL